LGLSQSHGFGGGAECATADVERAGSEPLLGSIIPDHSFDAVVMAEVIEHLFDDVRHSTT